MRRLGSLLALVLVATAGCAPPYFADLDSAATVTAQMTYLGTIGPFSFGSNLPSDAVRFFPTKPTASLAVQSGFVVKNQGGFSDVSFVYPDPSSGSFQEVTGVPGFPLAGADPDYPLYQFDVVNTTGTANLVMFYLDPSDPTRNFAELLQGSGAPTPQLASPVPVQSTVIAGASVLAGLPADTFSALAIAAGSPPVYGCGFGAAVDGVTTVLTSPAVSSNPLLPASNRYLYFHVGTTNYAQYNSGGQWVCYTWPDPPLPTSLVTLTAVTHRLDAALSSGDLLSMEGGVLRLYGPSGNPLFTRTVGNLRFCYEAYVGAVPYLFFTLALSNQHGDWTFNTYAIPTLAMGSLH